jgi:hypothetical protein
MYHRVGILKLRYFDTENMVSQDLIAKLGEFETSRTARLGPKMKNGKKQKASNDVLMELKKESWKTETVIIV